MKLIRNIILSFILMFTMTSCEDWFYIDHIGKPVEFGITTGKSIKTRTSYTGNFEGNTEWIYWSKDDRVSIYMDWDDGSGYTGKPELGIYKVNPGSDKHEKEGNQRYGRISYDGGVALKWHGDFKEGDGHAHEYPHTFYSIYPADGGKNFDGTNITFNIPATQEGVNMNYAYMTAYEPDVNSATNGDSHVDLHYYPRVTTLYIAVVNDTDETINGGNIILKSSSSPISGNYTVSFYNLSGESGTDGDKEITNSIKTLNKGDSDTVAFFIRPREYASNELSLTFNGSEKVLKYDNGFNPNKKYNIRIKASNQGQPDIEEPEVVPPVIGNPEAQMIFALLLQHDHFTLWELLGDYFTEYFGYTAAYPDLLDGLWNNKIKGVENLGLEQMYDELIKWFPDDKLNGLLDAIGLLTEIELAGNGPDLTADTLNFSIFKNAKKIHFDIRQQSQMEKDGECREIIFDGLSSLECIDIKGESSGTYNLSISNCPKLQKCDLRNDAGLKLKNLSITNCSTKTDGAYIHISSQDGGTFTLTRSGDTKNVIVECGYYDMISYWPLVYGDWHATWTDSI